MFLAAGPAAKYPKHSSADSDEQRSSKMRGSTLAGSRTPPSNSGNAVQQTHNGSALLHQQQHNHQDHQAAAQDAILSESSYLQDAHVCSSKLAQPSDSVKVKEGFHDMLKRLCPELAQPSGIVHLLQPGQSVVFKPLQLEDDDYYSENGQQQQLHVMGLLGSGGSSEAYEAQELSNSSYVVGSTPGAVAAAATAPGSSPIDNTGGNSSSSAMGGAHLVLKVPMLWDSVSDKPEYAALFPYDISFYRRCVTLMQQECELLTNLEGTCGIIRCHGYGVAQFSMPSGCVVPAHGLLLEFAELGSLAQQLKLGSSSFAALSAAEAWQVMRDVTQAVVSVHKAGYVYEDLKPANICGSMASGSLAYKLIDFGSCVLVQPSGVTLPQVVGGTTGYMAPEVEQQLPHTFNADTWSLGESDWHGIRLLHHVHGIRLLHHVQPH
jgi:hypothetical protein